MNDEISRRNLLKITASAATALTGSNWVFRVADGGRIVKAQATDAGAWKPAFLTADEVRQLAALCEAIIPRTDTPGARDARVHEYIDVALSVETPPVQQRFREGLVWMEGHCRKQHRKSLADATTEEVTAALEVVSDTNDGLVEALKPGASFFTDLKSRTIFGYYTSREGWVEELGRPEHVGMEKWVGCSHPDETH